MSLLGKVGIKKSKTFVYMLDLNRLSLVKTNSATSDLVSIRVCDKADIKKLPKEHDKSRFVNDLKEDHHMMGAFFHEDMVGWLWLSFQKVYMSEIEKWFDFGGGFFWRGFVLNKYRNRGIGKKMVEYGLHIIDKKSDKKEAYVVIETDNIPSQRLFESLGFKKQGVILFFRFFTFKKRKEISF